MAPARERVVVIAALVCGVGVVALILTSDREDAGVVWAVFGPLVMWSFVGTGLYARRRRPASRTGALMVMLGFAYGVAALNFSEVPLLYTVGLIAGGLWGAVFLQLVMAFPSGRLAPGRDRAIVIAGYVIFTLATVPAMLFAAPSDLGCDDCPENVLLLERNEDVANIMLGLQALVYLSLFLTVLIRLTLRWRRTRPLERLQLTPVYVCGLVTFLLATAATATANPGDALTWAANIAVALLPFAFLAGLLRSHVAHLNAELLARLEELRASRARLVQAGDAERRRLERDLHDGAQSRLVGITALLAQARKRVDGDAEAASILERAQAELQTSLRELRELARGIHPALLTERGLEPALRALAARAPVPVTIEADTVERLPGPVEIAAYYVVSEGLTNVAKYAQASEATVAIRSADRLVTVEISDDGIGGADAARGSGLRGLADRVATLDGTMSVDSPAGCGTRLRVEIPCAPATSSW
jgi:signal transduction histidine kinase